VTSAFRVGRGALKIRERVEACSPDLTSSEGVSLIQALEPYGARCEGNRRKGIMIKLPTARPGIPSVAKFIHRTHASQDGFDCHTAEVIKDMFEDSVFTIDRFREASP
jgi:hypothetical protein